MRCWQGSALKERAKVHLAKSMLKRLIKRHHRLRVGTRRVSGNRFIEPKSICQFLSVSLKNDSRRSVYESGSPAFLSWLATTLEKLLSFFSVRSRWKLSVESGETPWKEIASYFERAIRREIPFHFSSGCKSRREWKCEIRTKMNRAKITANSRMNRTVSPLRFKSKFYLSLRLKNNKKKRLFYLMVSGEHLEW